MWQDYVISIGTIILALALIPLVRDVWQGTVTVPPFTAITTTMILLGTAICYASLGLVFGMITSVVTGATWFFIFFCDNRRKLHKN